MKLQDVIESAGFRPRSYSGRSMYGKECLGVSAANVPEVILAIGLEAGSSDVNVPTPKIDQLGLGYIIYWPSIPFEGNDKE